MCDLVIAKDLFLQPCLAAVTAETAAIFRKITLPLLGRTDTEHMSQVQEEINSESQC